VADRAIGGPEPSQQERVARWIHRRTLPRKPDLEACPTRGIRDPLVGAPMRVSDRRQTFTHDRLKRLSPVTERTRKGAVIEERKRVVAEGVKADLHSAGHKPSHVIGAYSRGLGIRPDRAR
jgi:hypothetical protein